MIYIFYHNEDLDGIFSALTIKYYYEKNNITDLNFIGCTHNTSIDIIQYNITNLDTVYIVDYCFKSIDSMIWLYKNTNLIWLDHHNTSINLLSEYSELISGIRCNNISAVELTYKYLFNDDIPRFIKLLSLYDTFNIIDDTILPFQWYMRSIDNESYILNNTSIISQFEYLINLSDIELQNIITTGNHIIEYEKRNLYIKIKNTSKKMCILGYNFLVLNLDNFSPFIYDLTKNDDIDIYMTYSINSNSLNVRVSIRTILDGIDVSRIANAFGGGGHIKAAGFSTKILPCNESVLENILTKQNIILEI